MQESVLVGVGVICLLLAVVQVFIARLTNEYAVTSRRVIIKAGCISRDTLELNLSKLESVSVSQGIVGRILGYGRLIVRGTGGTAGTYKYVANPLAFKRAVNEASESPAGGSMPIGGVA